MPMLFPVGIDPDGGGFIRYQRRIANRLEDVHLQRRVVGIVLKLQVKNRGESPPMVSTESGFTVSSPYAVCTALQPGFVLDTRFQIAVGGEGEAVAALGRDLP